MGRGRKFKYNDGQVLENDIILLARLGKKEP